MCCSEYPTKVSHSLEEECSAVNPTAVRLYLPLFNQATFIDYPMDSAVVPLVNIEMSCRGNSKFNRSHHSLVQKATCISRYSWLFNQIGSKQQGALSSDRKDKAKEKKKTLEFCPQQQSLTWIFGILAAAAHRISPSDLCVFTSCQCADWRSSGSRAAGRVCR